MESKSYLIFSLNGLRYGVETEAVSEIFFLPELTPVEAAPPDIAGVLNLRGEILPVMDLAMRFGRRQRDYQITDSTIVLEWEEVKIGIVVSEVHEIKEIDASAVETQIAYGRKERYQSQNFISGLAKIGSEIYMILDPENLIRNANTVTVQSETTKRAGNAIAEEPSQEETEGLTEGVPDAIVQNRVFCPNASPQERAIFKERAENLMRATEAQDLAGLMPLAVVGLNGEYFGLDLHLVREFTDIHQITPVPCVKEHIVGNINLRGEVVTLVDIRTVLNMPISSSGEATKAMVVEVADVVAGVTIDEVWDVFYLHPSQIKPVPAAVRPTGKNEYLRGTAPYRSKMMSLLDVGKIFTQGELVVNEEA
ncbi:MAG TPA: purine-binding chemotaxis protein CheW [Oscillatoriaceae cyanobacterium M33_DOE_052]|uniref:Purine-binding chemotaxis protein CheW n=1 Tax=Planktothricoides sp. SpSt-374 TaxID=2282167 RepID=A0A7C3ZKU4_9CYAN|nr:purine-binding chemotaxis protein CheW [Oscillatoriaceae cyanobacterium M33_DOE_052]